MSTTSAFVLAMGISVGLSTVVLAVLLRPLQAIPAPQIPHSM